MKKYSFILAYNAENFNHSVITDNIVDAVWEFWRWFLKSHTLDETQKAQEYGILYYNIECYAKYYTTH